MSKVHLRKLFLAFLIPMGIYGTSVKAPSYVPQVKKWRTIYYVDCLNQTYKNAMASFIAYLLQETPSKETFNKEFNSIHKAFPNPRRDFHLAIVKLFENALLEAYKTGKCCDDSWSCMLNECYDCVYTMLDDEHKTYNYGENDGIVLPFPDDKNRS